MSAITVTNVSKRYRKGQIGYHTLREDIYNLSGRLIRLKKGGEKEYIWALKDVSFQVEKGEKLGIIGPNGSGKTTILRLLAGITSPTQGNISLKGRIGVLIELQAGFHPELTGRENVYLNGAIMGMSRKEIRSKFDEIVSFAGVEEFIDTPIKRYSSGMNVRLGFAVAAHLDPEILLVDEVLAVGDAAFRQKCMVKMGAAAQEGRTVVFVSHNMAMIENLCPRVLLLNNGQLILDDNAETVLIQYQKSIVATGSVPVRMRMDRMGVGGIKIHDVQIVIPDSGPIENIRSGQKVDFVIEFIAEKDFHQVEFSISFGTLTGVSLFYSQTQHSCAPFQIHKGHGRVICTVDAFPLAPGTYTFNVNAFGGSIMYDWVLNAGTFRVIEGDFFGKGITTVPGHSPFLVKSQWKMQEQGNLA